VGFQRPRDTPESTHRPPCATRGKRAPPAPASCPARRPRGPRVAAKLLWPEVKASEHHTGFHACLARCGNPNKRSLLYALIRKAINLVNATGWGATSGTPDIALTSANPVITVPSPGQSGTATLTITTWNGFNGSFQLSYRRARACLLWRDAASTPVRSRSINRIGLRLSL
jgi:hypothetical protein